MSAGIALDAQALAQQAATGAAARVRATPVRVALFGDSQANVGDIVSPANQDYSVAAANQDYSVAAASAWQSGLVSLTIANGKWMTDAFYPQAYLVGGGGISGQTTTQMVARDTLASSITRRAVADMLNLNPDVVIYRGGSINNFAGLTVAGNVASTVATAQAEALEIVTRFATSGVPVIVVGIYGYGGSVGNPYTGDPTLIRQAIVAQNANLRAIAAQFPNCIYVDPVGVLSDATGAPISANFFGVNGTDQGVHLTSLGAHLMAQAEAAALTTLFGPSANDAVWTKRERPVSGRECREQPAAHQHDDAELWSAGNRLGGCRHQHDAPELEN